MGLVWFILFCLPLAASSLAELEVNQETIQLNIYHARAPGSSLDQNSSSTLSDVLLHDEERVKALNDRISGKGVGHVTSVTRNRNKSAHLLEPKSVNIPLKSGLSIGAGNYYVKLGLGSPPKYSSLLVDTGSSLSWLQCQPCAVSCHTQTDPLFDPSSSKTYKVLSCDASECSLLKAATLNDPVCGANTHGCIYTASYGDASFSIGYLSQDQLTLSPSQTLRRFVFGCGQDNQGLFGRSSGIVGLARDKLSLLAQLAPSLSYSFSYCLPTSSSLSSGVLSIGSVYPAPYKFTPMLTDSNNPSLYFLRLSAVAVAGKPLPLSAAQYNVPTIIDSGTVITRLPMSVYAAMRQAFVKIMSTKYEQAPAYSILDACFQGSLKSISAVPQIKVIFQGGAELGLGARNTLIEVDQGVTCLAFASSGSRSIAIIGNRQQQTFNVAYDVSKSKIGFAPRGCH